MGNSTWWFSIRIYHCLLWEISYSVAHMLDSYWFADNGFPLLDDSMSQAAYIGYVEGHPRGTRELGQSNLHWIPLICYVLIILLIWSIPSIWFGCCSKWLYVRLYIIDTIENFNCIDYIQPNKCTMHNRKPIIDQSFQDTIVACDAPVT